MKPLTEILQGLTYELLSGQPADQMVSGMTIDSRGVKPGYVFVCIPGFRVDGHEYAAKAYALGARVFVVEREIPLPADTVVIQVGNSRQALAVLAYAFYEQPGRGMNLVGITGTNGKTSVSFYIHGILMAHGHKTGIIGTVDTKLDHAPIAIDFATSTTPDTIELMQIIQHMQQAQADSLVMEVTSHALALHKVRQLAFDVSVFTNLTQDHLDLHGTMENYRDAKAQLFMQSATNVINLDDPYGAHMASMATGQVISYGMEGERDIKATCVAYTPTGTSFTVVMAGERYDFYLPIPGRFSVYNALGAIGAVHALGVPMTTIQASIKVLKTVPGRIESVPNDHNLQVMVDYAHTPDSLQNVIETAKAFTTGRVITVFGCGGDRDASKRPLMGAVASTYGDFTFITSDNPRTEDPETILDQIAQGMVGTAYERVTDREQAIDRAITLMTPTDTLIIAGKGHETYQIFADRTIDFDDRLVAAQAIQRLKNREEAAT